MEAKVNESNRVETPKVDSSKISNEVLIATAKDLNDALKLSPAINTENNETIITDLLEVAGIIVLSLDARLFKAETLTTLNSLDAIFAPEVKSVFKRTIKAAPETVKPLSKGGALAKALKALPTGTFEEVTKEADRLFVLAGGTSNLRAYENDLRYIVKFLEAYGLPTPKIPTK